MSLHTSIRTETQENFDFAVYQIKNSSISGLKTKNPTNDEKLKFYGLYKQAIFGDCSTVKPWAVQVTDRAKWESWNAMRNMTKETAMVKYCELYMLHMHKF